MDIEPAGASAEKKAIVLLKLQGLWPQLILSARRTVSGWSEIPDAAFRVTLLTGGMSNLMTLVEVSGPSVAPLAPTIIVARFLSEQLNAVIDRKREASIVQHLSGGIGPQVFGFDSLIRTPSPRQPLSFPPVAVRFEEYIPGRTLNIADLRDDSLFLQQMAHIIACFHQEIPNIASPAAPTFTSGGPTASLPELLTTFLAVVSHISRHVDELLAARPADISVGLIALRDLIALLDWSRACDWIVQRMRADGGPIALVHGDLQASCAERARAHAEPEPITGPLVSNVHVFRLNCAEPTPPPSPIHSFLHVSAGWKLAVAFRGDRRWARSHRLRI
jgi:hypothetical protein